MYSLNNHRQGFCSFFLFFSRHSFQVIHTILKSSRGLILIFITRFFFIIFNTSNHLQHHQANCFFHLILYLHQFQLGLFYIPNIFFVFSVQSQRFAIGQGFLLPLLSSSSSGSACCSQFQLHLKTNALTCFTFFTSCAFIFVSLSTSHQ